MAGETQITIVGNTTGDPELRFTPTGQAMCAFTVASTPRFFDKQTNAWKDGEALFLRCTVWGRPGENAAESLKRGDRVIVQGTLKQRTYETKEGEKRTVYEVNAEEVGVATKFAVARAERANRQSQNGGAPAADPWATATPATAPAGGGWSNGGDEPPF